MPTQVAGMGSPVLMDLLPSQLEVSTIQLNAFEKKLLAANIVEAQWQSHRDRLTVAWVR